MQLINIIKQIMTKEKIYETGIVGILLIIWIMNSFSVFVYRMLFFPNSLTTLENTNILLYTLILLLTFPFISTIIGINQGQIHRIGFDKFYLLVFAFSGILQLYYLPYTIITAMALVYLLPLLFENNKGSSEINNKSWNFFSILTIFLSTYLVFHLHSSNLILYNKVLLNFFIEKIPISIYEEAIFRGIFLSLLLSLNISRVSAFIIQGILFWLVHINYLPISPIAFWIIIPIISFILSFIVFRTKSIALSAVTHVVINYLLFVFQT